MSRVEVTYQVSWRSRWWDDTVPSRPAWFVTCPDHPHVGKSGGTERWGYTTQGIARSVATRHEQSRYHRRAA